MYIHIHAYQQANKNPPGLQLPERISLESQSGPTLEFSMLYLALLRELNVVWVICILAKLLLNASATDTVHAIGV